jgi:hypothetical protein
LTILDVVVLLASAILLFALLCSAMVYCREAGRRTACRNNLKALGLALHDYHEAHKVFPPGVVAQNRIRNNDVVLGDFVAQTPLCDEPALAQSSGLTLLLPFIDERRTYDQYNLSLAACSLQNETSVGRVLKSFVCPSNPRQGTFVQEYYLHANETRGVGPTDYVFALGGFGQLSNDNPYLDFGICGLIGRPGLMKFTFGAFGVNTSTRISSIRDGVSTTLAMGESVGGLRVAIPPAGMGNRRIHADEPVQGWDEVRTTDQAWSQGHVPGVAGGYGAVFGATAWNAWFNTDRILTDPSLWIPIRLNEGRLNAGRPTWASSDHRWNVFGANGTALPADLGSAQGFRSFHLNGVQFLMAEGSVRTIHEYVDARLLVALSSIMGREEIPQDWQ